MPCAPTGQIEVPTAGEWTLSARSRNGLARITLSSGAALELKKNGSGEVTATLAAGRHGIEILHLVPDVHNDLQLTFRGAASEEVQTLYDVLVPLSVHLPGDDLVR